MWREGGGGGGHLKKKQAAAYEDKQTGRSTARSLLSSTVRR